MSDPTTNILDEILVSTRARVAEQSAERPLDELQSFAGLAPEPRPFAAALARAGGIKVIAEHKRRSPSRGAIREDLDPVDVVRGYEKAGAAALSVLTDEAFFGGTIEHLVAARAAAALPVLRKDFVVDPWQIWEARAAGADAVLLIAAALEDDALKELLETAGDAGMDALVEVHDRDELDRALSAEARIVGVNCRDLKTMEVSLDTALSIASAVPAGVVAVAESGIKTGEDLRTLADAGFSAFLIGEHLMSAPDPGEALRALLASAAGDAGADGGAA
jgi:indole-3-glycerol phosphate synthase